MQDALKSFAANAVFKVSDAPGVPPDELLACNAGHIHCINDYEHH
jgi:hypothetical protein